MRSPADLATAATLALALLLSACEATATPTSTASVTPTSSPSPVATASSTVSPTTSEPDAVGITLPAPGTPWDGAALLDEMRRSTRPGGVPDEVQTPSLAEAIAAEVWTVDGATWDTIAIGGFCGTSTCTIDLAGAHLGRAGEDLWTVEIDLASGDVEPIVADVRSLPWDLVDELDGLARSLDDGGDLASMMLTTARWLPPPAEPGRFVLSYRSGGEEGSCAREVLLDAAAGVVVEQGESGC